MKHEGNLPIPITKRGNYPTPMAPPPSSMVTSFDWSRLTRYFLPSYVPFQFMVQAYNAVVHGTIIDEGASVSILSSTTWKD